MIIDSIHIDIPILVCVCQRAARVNREAGMSNPRIEFVTIITK